MTVRSLPKRLAICLALFTSLLAILACNFGSSGGISKDIAGNYDVTGTNFDGSAYKGTVVIEKSGNGYTLAWETGPTSSTGAGTLSGDTFTVRWTDGENSGDVTYTLQADGSLVGTWTADGIDGQGTETLTPRH